MTQRLAPAAFDLIVRFETGGREYYERVYRSRPCWPGGRSGITIGCGYDLGYEKLFATDWQSRLPLETFARLARCIGKIGSVARQSLSGVRDIEISWEAALEVFNDRTLPQEIRNTLKAFPGSADKLTANAFGALVSLIFNRGLAIDGSDRRREMLEIRKTIIAAQNSCPTRPDSNLHATIASLLRSMKRLWHNDPESDGDLVDRREAEARLVECGS
jgi:hypothetical protein